MDAAQARVDQRPTSHTDVPAGALLMSKSFWAAVVMKRRNDLIGECQSFRHWAMNVCFGEIRAEDICSENNFNPFGIDYGTPMAEKPDF
jgi:hypothetical protein